MVAIAYPGPVLSKTLAISLAIAKRANSIISTPANWTHTIDEVILWEAQDVPGAHTYGPFKFYPVNGPSGKGHVCNPTGTPKVKNKVGGSSRAFPDAGGSANFALHTSGSFLWCVAIIGVWTVWLPAKSGQGCGGFLQGGIASPTLTN